MSWILLGYKFQPWYFTKRAWNKGIRKSLWNNSTWVSPRKLYKKNRNYAQAPGRCGDLLLNSSSGLTVFNQKQSSNPKITKINSVCPTQQPDENNSTYFPDSIILFHHDYTYIKSRAGLFILEYWQPVSPG